MDKSLKFLFVCTSNADRSPALEKYFREIYPQHEYRSAGVNKYFTSKKGTHYLTQKDMDWADLIVFAESKHLTFTDRDFCISPSQATFVLDCGNYLKGNIHQGYINCAEQKLKFILTK